MGVTDIGYLPRRYLDRSVNERKGDLVRESFSRDWFGRFDLQAIKWIDQIVGRLTIGASRSVTDRIRKALF